MARLFTAGNELADPEGEGWYWDNTSPYVSINQRFGPRTSELNSGEWYYYLPQNYHLKHILGTHGRPASFPVAEPYSELFVRFHYYPFSYINGERSLFSFIGADGSTPFFTLAVYDQGGSGTSGNQYGMRFREDRTGTAHIQFTNVAPNNQWVLVEARCLLGAGGTGTLEVRINEVIRASVNGTFLGPVGETGMSGVHMQNIQNTGATQINGFDNWAVNDTSGSFNNSWPGDGYVYLRTPHRDGATTQLATDIDAGGVDNAGRISASGLDYIAPSLNRPNSLVGNELGTRQVVWPGFVQPTAVPQKDTYTVKPFPFDAGQVNAVSVFSRAKSRDALAGNVRHLLTPPAQSEIQGGAKPLGQSMDYQSTHFDINPNTASPFTVSEIEDGELGIQFEA